MGTIGRVMQLLARGAKETATFTQMRVALIADARSEHTRRWVTFLSEKDEVMLLSTHSFSGEIPGVKIVNLPQAL
jgi:nitrogen-specific signal transduction histidine kinase